jgi:hypothetical protein
MIRGKHALAGLFVIAASGLFGMACAKNESTLYVREVKQVDDATCAATADEGTAGWLSGVLDVALRLEYDAVLLVGSQLITQSDPTTLKTETSKIQLYATDVQVLDEDGNVYAYTDAAGNSKTSEFSTPSAGFVNAATGAASFGLIGATLVDYNTAKDLQTQLNQPTHPERSLVASVVVHGRTLGGNELVTAPFTFPIRVCYGCLVTFPPDAISDEKGAPAINCRNTQATATTTSACRVGQDKPVPCTECRSVNPEVCNP